MLFVLKLQLYLSLIGCACYCKVMLQSGKYDLVHELFRKMKKSGEAPKALNYKGILFVLHVILRWIYHFCP